METTIAMLLGWYLLASVICLAVYAIDKRAARRKQQRIPERTLLMLGLAGGWPGALIGQRVLRHKSVKQPFLTWFWLTVTFNICAVALLAYIS